MTAHSQSLSGLSANTLYHYRVRSKDAAGNQAVSGDFSFTTQAPPDTTPPVISAIASSGISATGATIGWTTNEPADTQVEYGLTTAYGSTTTLDTALVTSHSQALSGLSASMLYHYRVRSKDAAGNQAVSGDFSFTTQAPPDTTPPVISAIASSGISATGATISWTTAKSTTTLPITEQSFILGSATDLWGRSSWTTSQLSNTNFRVRVASVASSTARDFSLDVVGVRVTAQ